MSAALPTLAEAIEEVRRLRARIAELEVQVQARDAIIDHATEGEAPYYKLPVDKEREYVANLERQRADLLAALERMKSELPTVMPDDDATLIAAWFFDRIDRAIAAHQGESPEAQRLRVADEARRRVAWKDEQKYRAHQGEGTP